MLPICLLALHFVFTAGFRIIYNALIDEWSENYLLCRAAETPKCDAALKRRLAVLGKSVVLSTTNSADNTYVVELSLQSPWGKPFNRRQVLHGSISPRF